MIGRNRRRYGGYVVHAAIVLLAIGIAGSSAYQTVREQKLLPGQSMAVGGYDLRYRTAEQRLAANAKEIRTRIDVSRGGHSLGTMSPGKNSYTDRGQVSNEVAIRTNWLTGEDLYLIADQIDKDGTLYLQGAGQAARQPDLARRGCSSSAAR